eukprot:TRINITY_DN4928_c0_g1_i2.p1 TRINITY_DN4928_c0_g1~~TRINITY_DN4928_c0_g1_i2.p1  ORF type:complete len:471 (-),score=52.31 TRINITY_DN4928_c0_g1_i2:94-1506(-)
MSTVCIDEQSQDAHLREVLPEEWHSDGARWRGFMIGLLATAVAAGPAQAWSTLEPLMIDAGLFADRKQKEELDSVFMFGNIAQSVAMLPSGILYDEIGARFCGVTGALGAAVGLTLMATSCLQPRTCAWLIYPGYCLSMFFGTLGSYAFFCYIWLLPRHESFVVGATNGANALGDSFALLAVAAYNYYRVGIGKFYGVMAVGAFIAAPVSFKVIPEHDIITALMQKASPAQSSSDAFRSLREKDEEQDRGNIFTRAWVAIKRSCKFLGDDICLTSALIFFATSVCAALLIPTQQMLWYYKAMFKDEKVADELVDMFAFVYGILGFISSALGGQVVDWIGLVKFTILTTVFCVAAIMLSLVHTYFGQVCAQVMIVFCFDSFGIVLGRYAMLYAPSELFGTLTGVLGIIVTLITGVIDYYFDSMISKNSVGSFQVPYMILATFTAISGSLLAMYWIYFPPASEEYNPSEVEL